MCDLMGAPLLALSRFPAFRNGYASLMLNTISFGGCQVSPNSGGTAGTAIGRWTNATTDAGASQAIPLLL